MDTVIQRKLAKRLRELREQKKLTQEKLAELSGVDYKHIQLLESKDPPERSSKIPATEAP